LNNSLFRHSGQAERNPESGKYLKIPGAGLSPAWRALHNPLFVIPVKTGIQEVIDNTGYRPSPV
jgi:hypothetical protein